MFVQRYKWLLFSLSFLAVACQESSIPMMKPATDKASANRHFDFHGTTVNNPSVRIRSLMEQARKEGIKLAVVPAPAELTDANETARQAATTLDAGRGCEKIKSMTADFPGFWTEKQRIGYAPINKLSYVSVEYSDDPSFNGSYIFTYSPDGKILTVSFRRTSGEVLPEKDFIRLNAKGYAEEWYHDLTNYYYDKPYTDKMEYDAAGYPTRFTSTIDGEVVSDIVVTYTKERNFQSGKENVSGDIFSYTYDLTRPKKVQLLGSPVWQELMKLYGENNSNYLTKFERKSESGELLFTEENKYEFDANGNPTKRTVLLNGNVDAIYTDITFDCKNYTYGAPRSWK